MAHQRRDTRPEFHKPDEVIPLTQDDEEEAIVWTPSHVTSNGNHDNIHLPLSRDREAEVSPQMEVDTGGDRRFLNDEVEKLFDLQDRFQLNSLLAGPVQVHMEDVVGETGPCSPSEPYISEKMQFNEDDFSIHRRMSYPHIHQPLRSLSSRSLKVSKPARVKKKKKKKKMRSFPSRGAIQSPTIPEEKEEDEEESSSEEDDDDDDNDERDGQYGGSEGRRLSGPSLPGTQVDFFIGEAEEAADNTAEGRITVRAASPDRNYSPQYGRKESLESGVPTFPDLGSEPALSAHATSLGVPVTSASSMSSYNSGHSRVQFFVGNVSDVKLEDKESDVSLQHKNSDIDRSESEPQMSQSDDKLVKKKHRHHHHHEHFKHEDLRLRRQKGSEVHLDNMNKLKRSPTETEEAILLHTADLDEMASHRWEDVRGIRRHKIGRHRNTLHSIVHVGKVHKEKKEHKSKSKFDHSSHEVFVELDELYVGDEVEWEWREKARWIKFEEDVEEGAERWGKPHVASLSFHSLLELRRGLENGCLLLDLEATDLQTIVHYVVENMVIRDQIREEDKGNILRTLLLKHKHVSDRSTFLRRNVSYINLAAMDARHQKEKFHLNSMSSSSFLNVASSHALNKLAKSDENVSNSRDKKESAKLEMVKVDVDNNMTGADGVHIGITPTEQSKKNVQDIMRRIPPGSEASTVLVGRADYLEKPTIAFVRLARGTILENLTEVPLPTRFIIIVLGPEKGGMDYHEVGRSISTLMANQLFHDVAYKAQSREELLHAINGFLDDSIVLPPGDWDHKTLLPIMDMARKRANVRRRARVKQEEKEALLQKEIKDKIPIDPLQRTGRLFGGLCNDVRRRYPLYLSDFKDALNGQSMAALVFIFFACLSPCIAFGGLLSEKTKGYMGVTETMLSTSLCGIIFGLFSGQPLLIVGATGPVLVFEQSLFKFCDSNGMEFLPFRCWIGMWVCLISIATVAIEGSFLIRYVTRFTEEIFAILISLIFIYEVIKKLDETFEDHPLKEFYCMPNDSAFAPAHGNGLGNHSNLYSIDSSNDSSVTVTNISGSGSADVDGVSHEIERPNTALLSTILTVGTFLIAYFLRVFRNSKFLGRSARRALGDFGILIAIVAMVLLDYLLKHTYTQKLEVPDNLSPTSPNKRGWFINPMGMNKPMEIWIIFAAIIPAFLIFILLFMEVQITEMILNKKDRKLKKGSGFHLDQFIMGLLAFVCALFGLPWMCAATVRTIAHVSALSVMSRTHAPGEKPKLLGVIEQRVTNIMVSVLIGVSLALGPLLREIPMAVLFGVFLYLGISAMSGVQMFERTKLLLMPVKHHPTVGYVRRVRTYKMHIFTICQLICLVILWVVKSTHAALAFPFLLILLIPLRLKLIARFYSPSELHELDKEEEDSDLDDEEEPDFYEQAHMPI
ncbi:anion exchange protein 2-like isoform X2 [Gigantopelta aegis]|uniref:anion exchange protein 2-like isoform X2 n=1 Tax=Gigantopelta aegis TaxID=1735272 RepID=UPI001B88D859|nr:anion exchange protein 2-like isoform X2 [Gigantopelta aegis]